MDLFVDGDIERQLKNTLGLNNFTKCELFEYICKKKAQEVNNSYLFVQQKYIQ